MKKLGEVLADMILYGDIEEAPIPDQYLEALTRSYKMTNTKYNRHLAFNKLLREDTEGYTRLAIAATLLKLTNDGQGGSCSINDKTVASFLKLEL